ncbi:MAG: hypothetical protein RLZZ609_2176 [Cyanobacteriota bacterium]|jgi:hypothetical protein
MMPKANPRCSRNAWKGKVKSLLSKEHYSLAGTLLPRHQELARYNMPQALIWSQTTHVVSKTQLLQEPSRSLTMNGSETDPDE